MTDLIKNKKGKIVSENEQTQSVKQTENKDENRVEVIRGNIELVMIKLMENHRNISLQILNELKAIKELLKARK